MFKETLNTLNAQTIELIKIIIIIIIIIEIINNNGEREASIETSPKEPRTCPS